MTVHVPVATGDRRRMSGAGKLRQCLFVAFLLLVTSFSSCNRYGRPWTAVFAATPKARHYEEQQDSSSSYDSFGSLSSDSFGPGPSQSSSGRGPGPSQRSSSGALGPPQCTVNTASTEIGKQWYGVSTTGIGAVTPDGKAFFYVDTVGNIRLLIFGHDGEALAQNASDPQMRQCQTSGFFFIDSHVAFGPKSNVTGMVVAREQLFIAVPPYVWTVEDITADPSSGVNSDLYPKKFGGPYSEMFSSMTAAPLVSDDFPMLFVADPTGGCVRGLYWGYYEDENGLAYTDNIGGCGGDNQTVQFTRPYAVMVYGNLLLVFDGSIVKSIRPDTVSEVFLDLSTLEGLGGRRVLYAYKAMLTNSVFLVVEDVDGTLGCPLFRLDLGTHEVTPAVALPSRCAVPKTLSTDGAGMTYSLVDNPGQGSNIPMEVLHCAGDHRLTAVNSPTVEQLVRWCEINPYDGAARSPPAKSGGLNSETVIAVSISVSLCVFLIVGGAIVVVILLSKKKKRRRVAPGPESPLEDPEAEPEVGISTTLSKSEASRNTIPSVQETAAPGDSMLLEDDPQTHEEMQHALMDVIQQLSSTEYSGAHSSSFVVAEAGVGEQEASHPLQQHVQPGELTSEVSLAVMAGAFEQERGCIRSQKFRKVKLLGRGAYGSVYSCLLANGKTIAMKEMMLNPEDFKTIASDVEREIDVMRQIRHENVVQYISAKADAKTSHITLFMELVTGGSLGSMSRSLPEPLPEIVVRRLIRQATVGLAFIHSKGIIHRDIKGDNMLLTTDGVVKLADFGTAKSMAPGASRGAQTMIGTPYYMAPELLNEGDNGEVGYGMKADVWSLGVTVGELLNKGTPPWPTFTNPGQAFLYIAGEGHVPTLPEHTSDLAKDFVLTCCCRDVSKRPSCAELLEHPWLHPDDNFETDSQDGDAADEGEP